MRPDEEFVANALLKFFGNEFVSILEGEDPPDFYLSFPTRTISVEVTRLFELIPSPRGVLGSRTTQDFFGIQLLDKLNITIGSLVPDGLCLFVLIEFPIHNPKRFPAKLVSWITEIASSLIAGCEYQNKINGSNIIISVHHKLSDEKRLQGP